jgi:hypothetical protein
MLHCSQLSQMPAGPMSKMDFRSNEAGRTVPEIENGEVRLIDFERSFHFR